MQQIPMKTRKSCVSLSLRKRETKPIPILKGTSVPPLARLLFAKEFSWSDVERTIPQWSFSRARGFRSAGTARTPRDL
jgi:hypothetical protein